MQVFINDPIHQTILFGIVLGIIFILTFSKKKDYTPLSLTQELKGFAILAVIFAHIGYALSTNPQFLFPFSVFGGVAVNLFLFLSGYGLTFSQMKKEETLGQLYKQRLLKLFVPFWIVLLLLFLLDYFLLEETYPKEYIGRAIFGIFTHADMHTDVNSPFWYFSLILFYYLLFPLMFSKHRAWITALVLYLAVWSVVKIDPPFLSGVIGLYQVHMLAFPLGVLTAWYLYTPKALLLAGKKLYARHERYAYPVIMLLLCVLIGYLALHGNVGKLAYIEEATSLAGMFAIILLFILKKRESKLCMVFGFFSYQIYLFHWPLMYRYDFLYTHFPAWIATLLYLGIFLALSLLLKKFNDFIFKVLAA